MKNLKRKFAINGANVFTFTQQEGDVVDKLPCAYYHIKFHPMMGYFLERKSDILEVPDEIFGITESRANLVLNTYNRKDESLGIALFGSKGAGKTLQCNVIANAAIAQGLPVLDLTGTTKFEPALLDFINSVGNCMVIIDEFFKNLAAAPSEESESSSRNDDSRKITKAQDRMLTFFSGTNNAKRLTVIIDNHSQFLNDFFRNRPSRLRYIFNYTSVERDIVEALCAKQNLPEEITTALITYSEKNLCTFDMINELIDEIVNEPVLSEVKLSDITAYMNVPTHRNYVPRQGKITEFKYTGDLKDVHLDNEIAFISSNSDVTCKLSQPNPWKDVAEELTEDAFDTKYDYEYSYSLYKKFPKDKRIPLNLRMARSDLVKIMGNSLTYSNHHMTITFQEVITEQDSSFYIY